MKTFKVLAFCKTSFTWAK